MTKANAEKSCPDSLTETVRAAASAKSVTVEMAARIMAEIDPWYDNGDRLDHGLWQAAKEVVGWAEQVHSEREQVDWAKQSGGDVDAAEILLAEAESELYGAKENVAAHCAAMVAAGEHGTDGREKAISDDWQDEWSMIVD